jgi:glycopeptide antibiotics resistance protein
VRSGAVNGFVAIAGGVLIAVLSFVPLAWVHYRRAGRFSSADLLALVVVPVYGLALWTYTLLPLPDPAELVCRAAILEPFHMVDDLRAAWQGSLLDLLRDPVFLQIALNVALFVPLGVILRVRYRRGLVWATTAGLGISLLIETTQLTGIWGLYDCAYRFFDVDDLVLNTSGAVLGSLLAVPLAQRLPDPDAVPAPTSPSFGRRMVALVSDAFTMVLIGAVAVVGWRIWRIDLQQAPPSALDPVEQAVIQWGAALAVEALFVLGLGCTVGEVVVRLRTVARSRAWTLPSRLVKLAVGPGLVAVFGAWDSPWSSVGLLVLATALVVSAATTRDHRGLANLAAGLDVRALPPAGSAP